MMVLYLPFLYDDEKLLQLFKKYAGQRRDMPRIHQPMIAYGGSLMVYLRNKSLYNHSVLYEDLTQDPQLRIKELLKDLGMDSNQAGLALRGLESDSQNQMFSKKTNEKLLRPGDLEQNDLFQAELGLQITSSMDLQTLRDLVRL